LIVFGFLLRLVVLDRHECCTFLTAFDSREMRRVTSGG